MTESNYVTWDVAQHHDYDASDIPSGQEANYMWELVGGVYHPVTNPFTILSI